MRPTPRAQPQTYRKWYGTARWRRRAHDQLAAEPWCRMCMDAGVFTAANTADHIVPHKGDPQAFWYGKLQSLCPTHHNRDKQREEIMATPLKVDDDGWPTAPALPPRVAPG